MSNLALSFASEMEKIAIRLRGFGRANDKVWSALVGPDKAAPHYLYRQINRMRMQGLNPTQTSALREINKRYLRDVQGVAPRGMGGQSIGIPGGNEGGVLLPMANLGGKKGITPVATGGRTGEKEIGTFFHPDMSRPGAYSKYVGLMDALRLGHLSPRQLQSISGKMDDVTKRYGKDLRSALTEFTPKEWDEFLKYHRGRELTYRGKEPTWTTEARRRLVEMGEIRPPPRPPARKKRKKPNMGKRVKTWHRR
tara:strand:+ start:2342 stop:3097 length:756 start_codon:yes stop_codon:yes gene_type:complete